MSDLRTINTALDRFLAICQSDPRILAVTLYGSYARGAADEWSDIDLGLVIADEAYDDFITERAAFMRQLGAPLFIEDFGLPGTVFFILADGTEGEITVGRESDFTEPYGPWRALVDKNDTLSKAKPRPAADPAEQVEVLRRQITWFWHDLSHFITAMARGHLWWATGQLEILRRTCVTLARLHHDFDDAEAGDDPYFKVDKMLPAESLTSLQPTFVPVERAAMLAAARALLGIYRELAGSLAGEHGLGYPAALEGLMLARLEKLDALPL